MSILTPEELRDAIHALRTSANGETIDAVLALLEASGVLGGVTPDEAAELVGRSAIRVRQLANDGQLDGIRFGSGKRGTLLLARASVERVARTLPDVVVNTGRPKRER